MGHIYVEAAITGTKVRERVEMFVDTGSTFSSLPQEAAERLGVTIQARQQPVEVAGGRILSYPVGVADIEIQGRVKIGESFLVGIFPEPVLGVLTLEALGLTVDPTTGEVKPSRTWQARASPHLRPVGSNPGKGEG